MANDISLSVVHDLLLKMDTRIRAMDAKIQAMDAKIQSMDKKIQTMDMRIQTLETGFGVFKKEVCRRLVEVEKRLDRLDSRMDRLEDDHRTQQKCLDDLYRPRDRVKVIFGIEWILASLMVAVLAAGLVRIIG